MDNTKTYSTKETNEEIAGYNSYARKTYSLMTTALAITTIVGYFTARLVVIYPSLIYAAFISMFIEMGMTIYFSAKIGEMSELKACILLYGIAAMSGFSFSSIFLAYDISDIFLAYGTAALLFFCLTIIARYANVDMRKYRGILYGALLALLIVSLLGIFIPKIGNNLLITYIGLLIFLAYVAYDTQMMRNFYEMEGSFVKGTLYIYAALELYLDLINIIYYLLRIIGGRRRDN